MKDEYKQTEGSPEVKAKIRRMQMETAANAGRQQAALDDVPDATAVITNPTHFAVALKYEVGSSEAPRILAMGRGNMAHQIIDRAKGADVTVFRSPLLARALYYTGEIGAEITEQLYQAVAVVLAYLYRVDKGEALAEPEVEIPESARFTENGQPLKPKIAIGQIMKRKSHERTVGTLISTVCYFVLAAFLRFRLLIIFRQAMACVAGGWPSARWPVLLVDCGMSFMIWLKS